MTASTTASTTASATASTTTSAADFIPPRATLHALRGAAEHCRGCHLYLLGTRTVFGEGPSRATTMLVGEQPGDVEDRAGRPFVGPAGKLLDRALEAAGIDRDDVYLTNAVKHFKWAKDARSARRLHKTPNTAEVRACLPWLEHEIALIRPRLIVCLGATAAKALLGRSFSVVRSRGLAIESPWAELVVATVHPSAILRAPSEDRNRAERMFVADLRKAARHLERRMAKHADREKPKAPRARSFRAWPTTARRSGTSSERIRSSPE
jgi:DNA polymerase